MASASSGGSGNELELANRKLRLEGDFSPDNLFVKSAQVVEGISKLTETKLEFITKDKTLELKKVVGTRMTLCIDPPDGGPGKARTFTGRCISAEYIGLSQGMGHFIAQIRPFMWFLTRGLDSRIFQDMSTPEIITQIMDDYGFGADLENKLTETYVKRSFCVQYQESDYDFLCRLMEEEGIYFFFIEDDKKEKLVIADSISAHIPVPGGPAFDFKYREMSGYRRADDHVFDWNAVESLTPGKVTLDDFDFSRPTAELKTSKSIKKGTHSFKSFEVYHKHGHLRDNNMDEPPKSSPTDRAAEVRTRVLMESYAIDYQRWRGACNIRMMANGQTFSLNDHPRVKDQTEFLIVSATHDMQIESDQETEETQNSLLDERLDTKEDNKDTYRCKFEVVPKSEPYRAKPVTPWPKISGLHTAIVTGPAGEEIYTDEYGRIKVQFHWDRNGKNDENSTCWVRCVMPWSGKSWGTVSIPRIGQEVVIQFEDGDPDRPICTGTLFNNDTMPPYKLPDNQTQSGIVTRSSPGGSEDTFHELIFEDKMEKELIRLQSERDYQEIIKNNAEITIGLEHQDPGDLTQTIHHTKTETIKTGDHIFKVEKGNQDIFVKADHNEKVEGKSDVVVVGNYSQTISQGDVTRTVSKGNEDVTVGLGNYKLDTSSGKIEITAMQSIELKVGANSIKIDQSGITIKGALVKIQASASFEAKSPMSTVKADTMLVLKGGLTMIN